MQKIKTSLHNTLDPLQFAYRPNRSTDDAISTTLHLALTYLENKGKGKWCLAKYGDPYSEFVLCI